MKLLRLYAANKILDFGFWLSSFGDDVVDWADAYLFLVEPDQERPTRPFRPAEQILLGSIVGLAICALWIWFAGRAGQ